MAASASWATKTNSRRKVKSTHRHDGRKPHHAKAHYYQLSPDANTHPDELYGSRSEHLRGDQTPATYQHCCSLCRHLTCARSGLRERGAVPQRAVAARGVAVVGAVRMTVLLQLHRRGANFVVWAICGRIARPRSAGTCALSIADRHSRRSPTNTVSMRVSC